MAGYMELGKITPDNLIGGHEIPLLTTKVTLLSGQGILKRGSVIGIISSSGSNQGKGKLCNKSSSDGSQVAKYILSQDVDTTSGDAPGIVYKTGIFNRNALIWGSGDSATSTHEDELRDVNIYLRDEYLVQG